MLVRLGGVAIALALLLAGGGDSAFGRGGSTAQLAAALGCRHGTPHAHPRDGYAIEACTFRGDRLVILTFQGTAKHGFFLALEGDPRQVHGSGWNVFCAGVSDCREVQRRIGGVLVPGG